MKKKSNTPTLRNKNGPITIKQRAKKDPITFQGFISGRFGNVEVKVTASVRGWDMLRANAWTPKEFADALTNDMIEPVYHDKIRDKPAKDEWTDEQYNKMKLLTALLFLYFFSLKKQKNDPIIDTVKMMGNLYPEKVAFKLSTNNTIDKSIKSFKATYLYDGNDILAQMLKSKNQTEGGGWFLHLLHVDYESRIQKAEIKVKSHPSIFAYSILSAAMMLFFSENNIGEHAIEKSHLNNKCFTDFGVVFGKLLAARGGVTVYLHNCR